MCVIYSLRTSANIRSLESIDEAVEDNVHETHKKRFHT